MGRHLSPQYGQVILVSGYPVLTAVNWSQHWCAICVQYQSYCAPRLARKCEIEHWLPCGADGRAGGQAVYGHVITKFSGMGRFTYPWCSAGALRAPELRYNICFFSALGFLLFIWILQGRVIVALLRRLHRSRWGNLYLCGLWQWRYILKLQYIRFAFFSLLTVVFLTPWFVNFFLTFFKASTTTYGHFH